VAPPPAVRRSYYSRDTLCRRPLRECRYQHIDDIDIYSRMVRQGDQERFRIGPCRPDAASHRSGHSVVPCSVHHNADGRRPALIPLALPPVPLPMRAKLVFQHSAGHRAGSTPHDHYHLAGH